VLSHFLFFQVGSFLLERAMQHYFYIYYNIRPEYTAIHDVYMANIDEIEMAHGKPVILRKMNLALSKMNGALQRIRFLKGFDSFWQLLYQKTAVILNHYLIFKYAPPKTTNFYERLKFMKDYSSTLSQIPDLLAFYGPFQAAAKHILFLITTFETQDANSKEKIASYYKNSPASNGLGIPKESTIYPETFKNDSQFLISFKNVTIGQPCQNSGVPPKILFENVSFSLPFYKNLVIMGPSSKIHVIGKLFVYNRH
jgi:hypothetical protein